jgi:hypothetical protein
MSDIYDRPDDYRRNESRLGAGDSQPVCGGEE